MEKKIDFPKKCILVLIGFSIAFDFHFGYILAAPLLWLYVRNRPFNLKLINLFILVVIFIIQFLFSYEELFLPEPFITLIRYILMCSILFLLIARLDYYHNKFFLNSLSFFMILNGLVIFGFSFYLKEITEINYGYGRLFNPVHGVETISPKISISTLSGLVIYCFCDFSKNGIKKIIICFLCLSGFWFVQSRIAIILTILLLLIYGYLQAKLYIVSFKRLIIFGLCIFITMISISIYTYQNHVESFNDAPQSRLAEDGLKSKRFEHWEDGFEKTIMNPLGGFKVDPKIEMVNYFHNILIDSARINGFISLIPCLLIIFYCYYLICRYSDDYLYLNIISLSMVVIVLMQDVIVEGNFVIFFIMLTYSICSYKKRC